MSAEIKVGDRRIFRSRTAREIEIIEQLADGLYAGEFRYRYVDELGGLGILPAENLEMSTRPAPTESSADAPQDHGPLAAHLSDRTLDKVLSRPDHVPSLVLLDRDAAAQHLADAVDDLLNEGKNWHEIAARNKVRVALADYRSAVTS